MSIQKQKIKTKGKLHTVSTALNWTKEHIIFKPTQTHINLTQTPKKISKSGNYNFKRKNFRIRIKN